MNNQPYPKPIHFQFSCLKGSWSVWLIIVLIIIPVTSLAHISGREDTIPKEQGMHLDDSRSIHHKKSVKIYITEGTKIKNLGRHFISSSEIVYQKNNKRGTKKSISLAANSSPESHKNTQKISEKKAENLLQNKISSSIPAGRHTFFTKNHVLAAVLSNYKIVKKHNFPIGSNFQLLIPSGYVSKNNFHYYSSLLKPIGHPSVHTTRPPPFLSAYQAEIA